MTASGKGGIAHDRNTSTGVCMCQPDKHEYLDMMEHPEQKAKMSNADKVHVSYFVVGHISPPIVLSVDKLSFKLGPILNNHIAFDVG